MIILPKGKKTQYAILGLLNIMPMSGYDIKKYIEQSISYFWTENYGAIYPTLNQLYKNGLVTKEEKINANKPNSKIYTITEQGRCTLLNWLKEKLEPEKIRDELLLKIFFGNLLSIEENIQRIEEEKRQKQLLLDTLTGIESMLKELKITHRHKEQELNYQLMTVLKGKYEVEADIDWCVTCLMILENMKNNTSKEKDNNEEYKC